MQLRKLLSIGAAFSLVVGIPWAGAALAADEDHSGPYLGIGVGWGFDDFDKIGGANIDTAFGFDAWGGHKFNKWVAIELQLEYLNGFDGTVNKRDVEAQGVTFGANLKIFPLASVFIDRIQPFVMAGPGFTWIEVDVDGFGKEDNLDFSARFGGGIDFYSTDHIALQFSSSYVLNTGGNKNGNYISLVFGVQYKF
jgi:opacity protein-like surface antigen